MRCGTACLVHTCCRLCGDCCTVQYNIWIPCIKFWMLFFWRKNGAREQESLVRITFMFNWWKNLCLTILSCVFGQVTSSEKGTCAPTVVHHPWWQTYENGTLKLRSLWHTTESANGLRDWMGGGLAINCQRDLDVNGLQYCTCVRRLSPWQVRKLVTLSVWIGRGNEAEKNIHQSHM